MATPTQLLMLNDISAGLVGGVWASTFNIPKPAEHAAKAVVISILSRVISQNSGMIPLVNADQKNEIVVGLFGILSAYMSRTSLSRGFLTQVAEDLIGSALVDLANLDNKYSYFDYPARTAPSS
jgi:hypothetical protein